MMRRPNPASHSPGPRRRGSVLVVALFIVFMLSGMVLVLARSMRVEGAASANQVAALQASAVERGAEQYVMALLTQQDTNIRDLSEDTFAAVQVGDGYFWILRPDYQDDTMPLFALTEESGKININTATYNMLMLLPGMTDELGAAIVDWRDADDTPTAGGSENQYYLALPEPYYCKNAPFETVEELLLVRGCTKDYLYGDGTAPPLGQRSTGLVHSTGNTLMTDIYAARGVYDLLTIYSAEPNSGQSQKVNINDANSRTKLRTLLREKLGAARGDQIVNSMGRSYIDVFDFYFRARLTREELGKVFDSLSTSNATRISGRINVNVAPRDVLLCLGLESADVDKLISQRSSNTSDDTSILWVLDALGNKAVGLGNRITGKTYQYSADILAVSGNGRAYKRCRIVVNTSSGMPQIVYRRDLTERGWPMDPEILASIRRGEGPGASAGGSGLRTSGLGGGLR